MTTKFSGVVYLALILGNFKGFSERFDLQCKYKSKLNPYVVYTRLAKLNLYLFV